MQCISKIAGLVNERATHGSTRWQRTVRISASFTSSSSTTAMNVIRLLLTKPYLPRPRGCAEGGNVRGRHMAAHTLSSSMGQSNPR